MRKRRARELLEEDLENDCREDTRIASKGVQFFNRRQGVCDASWHLCPLSRTAALSVLRSHSCGGSSGGQFSSKSSDVLQQRVRTIGESLPQRWKFALFLSSGTDSVILYTCTTVFGPTRFTHPVLQCALW